MFIELIFACDLRLYEVKPFNFLSAWDILCTLGCYVFLNTGAVRDAFGAPRLLDFTLKQSCSGVDSSPVRTRSRLVGPSPVARIQVFGYYISHVNFS